MQKNEEGESARQRRWGGPKDTPGPSRDPEARRRWHPRKEWEVSCGEDRGPWNLQKLPPYHQQPLLGHPGQ